MSNKLFVRSLAYSVTDSQLAELFATVGTVLSAKVIMDRDSGQSKGFGFVEMSSDQESQTAIRQLDGKELAGRQIAVAIAQPKPDRQSRPSYGSQRSRY